jgi:hypothetical protein
MYHFNSTEQNHELWSTGIMRIIVRNALCSLHAETNASRFSATELAGYMGLGLTSFPERFGYIVEGKS